MNVELKHIEI